MSKAIGIDGCKGGWIVAVLENHQLMLHLETSIQALWEKVSEEKVALIDIPIGLLEGEQQKTARACDAAARKVLGKKASSIFPVPCRQAAYIDPPEKATGWYNDWHKKVNAVNRKYLGKGLPIQSLGIVSKIREVDELLQQNQAARALFLEAHPEWCFQCLNEQALTHSKKTVEGKQERIGILSRYIQQFNEEKAIQYFNAFPRSKVVEDDILDAICLAVHAELGQQNGFLALGEEQDIKGISMKISYGNKDTLTRT